MMPSTEIGKLFFGDLNILSLHNTFRKPNNIGGGGGNRTPASFPTYCISSGIFRHFLPGNSLESETHRVHTLNWSHAPVDSDRDESFHSPWVSRFNSGTSSYKSRPFPFIPTKVIPMLRLELCQELDAAIPNLVDLVIPI
jgi:hypothetical protein